jgi:hypothetical protein
MKILHWEKWLPKHTNTQNQVLNHLIMDPSFDEIQFIEYPFILH